MGVDDLDFRCSLGRGLKRKTILGVSIAQGPSHVPGAGGGVVSRRFVFNRVAGFAPFFFAWGGSEVGES